MLQFEIASGGQSSIHGVKTTSGLSYAYASYGQNVERTFSFYENPPEYKKLTPISSWLVNALIELENVENEANEETLPSPTSAAKENARRIISSLAYMKLPQPSIYPTEKQEIAIFFKCHLSGVLIHCGPKGDGVCFATFAGKNRRARYDDAGDLPDEFVRAQLRQLLLTV